MKTISGKPISTKPISLSKAAKILSKFVSAENGASKVISVYLNRASSSFKELNELHKELKSPRFDRKYKRDRSETHCGNEEKSSQTVVKFSQESKDAFENRAENEGGNKKHKKKKKKHDVEFWMQGNNGAELGEGEGERKPLTKAVNEDEKNVVEKEKRKKKRKPEDESKKHGVNDRVEIEEGSNEEKISKGQESLHQSVGSSEELGDAGDDIKRMEEGKKHKKEKKKNKDKDGMNNFSGNRGQVGKSEDEIATRVEDQKETVKMLSNGLEGDENGGVVDHQEPQSKKNKKYKAGSEDKTNPDEVKRAQKKRKNEDMEGKVEDGSGQLKKKIKRKHGGDA